MKSAKIRLLTHGIKQNFRCNLFIDGIKSLSDTFETHFQAWTYGRNWKMLNSNYTYKIESI